MTTLGLKIITIHCKIKKVKISSKTFKVKDNCMERFRANNKTFHFFKESKSLKVHFLHLLMQKSAITNL